MDNYNEILEKNMDKSSEECLALDLIKGGRFNARLFYEQYEENTEKVLYALLSMQSNDNPLKKGGDSIAFRCSALIIQNRQNYTVPQNTLLDIITARMSSFPENSYYIIKAKEVVEELPCYEKPYIYQLMMNGCKELNSSPFIFEIDLEDGKKQILEFQWNEVLTYHGFNSLEVGEDAYISFKPTKFFRILTLSSTIMHGAHYNVGVSAQISSKYARNLFYYLEDMKNYREYPNATTGRFTLSLEELKYIVKYPDSYKASDVRRSVLEIAVNEINSIENIDFTFKYELIKTDKGGRKKQISHVKFIISQVLDEKTKEQLALEEEMSSAPFQMLKGVGLMDKECLDVLKKYKAKKRDIAFLTQAIMSVATSSNVKSKCALLCHIIENGLDAKFTYEENMKRISKEKENRFHSFEQHSYDYDELEKMLLTTKVSEK